MICCFNTSGTAKKPLECYFSNGFKFQVPVQEATLAIHYKYIFIRRGLGIYFNF